MAVEKVIEIPLWLAVVAGLILGAAMAAWSFIILAVLNTIF